MHISKEKNDFRVFLQLFSCRKIWSHYRNNRRFSRYHVGRLSESGHHDHHHHHHHNYFRANSKIGSDSVKTSEAVAISASASATAAGDDRSLSVSGLSNDIDESTGSCCGCIPISQEARKGLRQMASVSLLKDGIFVMFAISNFFTSIGFNVPYVYTVVSKLHQEQLRQPRGDVAVNAMQLSHCTKKSHHLSRE